MDYHWKHLHIQNYKSIKDLRLNCGTINVFIGPPNSGKSNILEALEIPNLTYMMPQNKEAYSLDSGFLDCKKFFRVDHARQLFRFADINQPIVVEGILDNQLKGFMVQSNFSPKTETDQQEFVWKNWLNDTIPFSGNFISAGKTRYPFFGQSYHYPQDFDFEHSQNFYFGQLQPPFGVNLGTTIRVDPYLQEMVREMMRGNGIDLVVDDSTGKLSIQVGTQSGFAVSLPYRALSDTLRRMIFYKAAVHTSLDKILILEEPEALSYPVYIASLAQDIVKASVDKQFFISTHSPYLLTEFVENVDKEKLAVFVCHYSQEEKQTKARRLSPDEITEVQNYGVDLFFNLEPYLDDPTEHNS